jgi:hypothetical protein
MSDHIQHGEENYDPFVSNDNLVKVLQHFSRMERNLRDQGWFSKEDTLDYAFSDLSRTLARYVTERRYEEYR